MLAVGSLMMAKVPTSGCLVCCDRCRLEHACCLRKDTAVQAGTSLECNASLDQKDSLLDVIDVPDLTEDERQAMKKLRKDKRKPRKGKGKPRKDNGKPRKDKGTKRKSPPKGMASKLIERIEAVENASTDDSVYDTYPQVVVKVKDFITRDGVTQATMCKVLGGIYHVALTLFLSGKNVYKCGKTYKAAYLFFEKFRILEGKDKSEDRVKNETENPIGFHQSVKELIDRIEAVENVSTVVFDTYQQVVVKLNDFIARDGVTKTKMCEVLGGIYHGKLNLFLSGGNINEYSINKTYKTAYLFFEKLRILEHNGKSGERLKNETENPSGFH